MTVQPVTECAKGRRKATAQRWACGQQGQAGCKVVKSVAGQGNRREAHSVSFIFLISEMRTVMVVNKVVRGK